MFLALDTFMCSYSMYQIAVYESRPNPASKLLWDLGLMGMTITKIADAFDELRWDRAHALCTCRFSGIDISGVYNAFLPPALAEEVMFSVPSVCVSVCMFPL